MSNTIQTKSGIKTTEFWTTAVLGFLGPVLTVLVGLGIVNPNDVNPINETVTNSFTGVTEAITLGIANLTSLIAVVKYGTNRTQLKATEAQAGARSAIVTEESSKTTEPTA